MKLPMLESLVFAAFALGCGASPTAPKDASLGEPFDLEAGTVALIEGEALRVTFEKVVNDSRCPIGVNCVWEGDGVVRVSLSKTGEEKAAKELHTNRGAGPAEDSYLSYVVRLEGLAPHPKADRPISPKDYLATLVVTKRYGTQGREGG